MKYFSKMMLALFFAVSLFLIPGTNQALYFPPTLYDNDQIVLVYGHMGHEPMSTRRPSSSNTTIRPTISWPPMS